MENEIPRQIYDDTLLLLKFLKARAYNLKQAESMLRKNLRWKKEMQIDSILEDFKSTELLTKHVGITTIGYTKDGTPVNYISAGTIDMKGIFKSTNYIYFLKHLVQIFEKDLRIRRIQAEKLGRPITQSINVYNFENLDLSQITHKQTVQNCIKAIMAFQDNYPEFLKRLYIINASTYCTFIWPLITKCAGPSLLEKIRIFGQDGWKEELLEIMDADELPEFLGGNKTDPDGNPMCLSFVNHSGRVPERYYLTKNMNKFKRNRGVKSEKIERQGKASVIVHITKPKSILNWEFEIKSQDIGFGLLLENTNETFEELIPVHRIRTEIEPYGGMYRCEHPGKYVIVFDNSYSWFYLKEVYYRTWITEAYDSEIK